MSWTEHTDRSLRLFLENMVAEGRLAQQHGIEASHAQIVEASLEALHDVIYRSIPLARIMDASDLVLHAEGPAVRDLSPTLGAVNWLSGTAERTVRKLSRGLFSILDSDAKRLSRLLDIRFHGFAQGSLYAGFSIMPVAPDLITEDDEPVIASVRSAVRALPDVPQWIGDDAMRPGIVEVLPDAAQRDNTLLALYGMAPSGRRGIHTVELTSPGHKTGRLSQRERIVLKEAIDRPGLQNRKHGAFVGYLREIDLDSRRFCLRDISSVGTLRCVIPALSAETAKRVLGEWVRVEGDYETDRDGRPRLMLAQRIEAMPAPSQIEIPAGR